MKPVKRAPGQFARTIERLAREGRTDAEIIAAHSFAWRPRAAYTLVRVRAAITKAEAK